MKFKDVIPALKEGKKIRRRKWNKSNYIFIGTDDLVYDQNYEYFIFILEDFEDENWEIVKEPNKVKLRDLTEEQFNDYCNKLTDYGEDVNSCKQCLFRYVPCFTDNDNCWIKHKDLYSDKFLDQEIEIEE